MLLLHQIILYILERIRKNIKTNGEIINEKLKHDINREVAKILSLSSRKMEEYEYLTDEEIVPFNQRQAIEELRLHILP